MNPALLLIPIAALVALNLVHQWITCVLADEKEEDRCPSR